MVSRPRNASAPFGCRAGSGTIQHKLAGVDVVTLVHRRVLRRDVQVAQSALQRRGIVNHASAAESEAGIGDANAGGREPDRGLRALHEERIVIERAIKRVLPMALRLDLEKRPCRPHVGRDAAEFALEGLPTPRIGTAARNCRLPVLACAIRSSRAPSAIPTAKAPCSSGKT